MAAVREGTFDCDDLTTLLAPGRAPQSLARPEGEALLARARDAESHEARLLLERR